VNVSEAREIRLRALRDALAAVMRAHGPIGDEPTYCAKALREMIETELAGTLSPPPGRSRKGGAMPADVQPPRRRATSSPGAGVFS
jgi:hypothetical protein